MISALPYDVVIVAPNPALDSFYVLPSLERGAVNRAYDVLHTAGGKGNNMARAVVQLGGRVMSLGIVGGQSGHFIAAELAREGIGADMVWTDQETRRCTSIPIQSGGEVTVVLQNGVPAGDNARTSLDQTIQRYADAAPFITFTGSLPPDFPQDYYAGQIRALHGHQARIAVDSAGERLKLAAEAGANIIKINAEEFSATFNQWSVANAQQVYTTLRERGLEILIVTDGARGAYVFSEDAPYRVLTPVESWVNTAGAGDTLLAALLIKLNAGETLAEAMRYASAAAAANLQQVGCGFVDLDDVQMYLAKTRMEVIHDVSA